MNAKLTFELPDELCAKEPPEARGLSRDDVRLLVIDRDTHETAHARFNELPNYLQRSDLLVFNRSRTLPVVLSGKDKTNGTPIQLRLAEHLSDDSWLGLLVCIGKDGDTCGFACGLSEGMEIIFPGGLEAKVLNKDTRINRLWRLQFNQPKSKLVETLYRFGRPVRYEYVEHAWPIDLYQNVYASEPGSSEMPSAGRAFTWRLMFDLKRQGIKSTSILLHTGLSSYLDDDLDASHPASEEELAIDTKAAEAINHARMAGGRIIAVGTTVVRALESVSDEHGFVHPCHEYTRLRIDAGHKLICADGLITGMHEPEASHLDLLSAFIDKSSLFAAYSEAIQQRYLWHEFGDLNLIL
jgi:S-adenosylmethionine:tRNA ribosyltransferase-isomerase